MKRLLTGLGEVIRLAAFLLLVTFLIILFWHVISPLSVETRLMLDYLLLAVITLWVLSFLLLGGKGETEEVAEEETARRSALWKDFTLAVVLGAAAGSVAWYNLMETRLGSVIAGLTGLLVVAFSLVYRRRM